MAEQNRVLSAAFPTPPPFYKNFTKDNLDQLKRLREGKDKPENTNGSTPDDQTLDVLSLPPEIRTLIPPEPPTDGRFKTFGVQHDVRMDAM